MFYICAICMIRQSPLSTLTPTHRKLLEGIVAPVIDTTPLKDTIMLLCSDCVVLIHTMEKFQNTVLKGVQGLIQLHQLKLERDGNSATESKENQKLEPEEWIPQNLRQAEVQSAADIDERLWAQEDLSSTFAADCTRQFRFVLRAVYRRSPPAPPSPAAPLRTRPAPLSHPRPIVLTSIKKEPAAEKPVFLPIKKEPENSLVELEVSDTQKTKPPQQPPVKENSLLLCRQLELTEEVDLKSEPASEPEEEPEYVRDSESTVTCDEDYGNEEDLLLATQIGKSESRVSAMPRASARRGRGARGGAAGRGRHRRNPPSAEQVSWEIQHITEAEALAELARARAAPPLAAAPLRCDHCAVAFNSRQARDLHATLHHANFASYLCHICTQRLPNEALLREHVSHHLTRYTCRSCRHSSSNLDAIKQHRCSAPDTQKAPQEPKPKRRRRAKRRAKKKCAAAAPGAKRKK